MTHFLQRIGRRRPQVRLEPWQRNLYTIVGAQLTAVMGFSISIPFLPFYIQQLGVTETTQVAFWVGLINSASPIVMALASPVWGLLADRYGRKPMLVRAQVGGGIMLVLMASAMSVPQLATLRIVQGAISGSVAAATTLVASTVPRERCGYSMGLLQSAIFLGHSLGPFAGGVVGATLGYRVAFMVSAAFLLVSGLLVALLVHEEFVRPSRRRQAENGFSSTLRLLTGQPVVLTALLLLMLNNLSANVTTPVLPLYVQTLVPTDSEASAATGLIVGATALMNAIGAIVVGRSADRLGQRRVLLTCMSIGALIYFPQMLTRNPTQLLLLRAIMGFAMGGVTPTANSLIAEGAPEGRQGGVYGISASFNSTGRALGPVLGAVVVAQWGIDRVFPVTGTLLSLVVLIVFLGTRSLRPAQADHPSAPVEPAGPDRQSEG